MRTFLKAILLFCAGALLAPESLTAQIIQGRVIDAETGEPIVGAQVDVRAVRGRYNARSMTVEAGSFATYVPDAGEYRIEASFDGYRPMDAVPVTVEVDQAVVVNLRLSRNLVVIDPLEVTARRADSRHLNTLAGALARHALLPKQGNRRVITRTDQEMRTATRLDEMVRHWLPRPQRCVILWLNGNLMIQPEAVDAWLESSAYNIALFEFYRDYDDAPLGLRKLPPYSRDGSRCTVMAAWTR